MLKVQDNFTLNKLTFMFGFIKGSIPDEIKRLFTFNYDNIHLYITRSFEVFHLPKKNTARFGINTSSFMEINYGTSYVLNCYK